MDAQKKYYAAKANTCLAATIVLSQRPDLHQLLLYCQMSGLLYV